MLHGNMHRREHQELCSRANPDGDRGQVFIKIETTGTTNKPSSCVGPVVMSTTMRAGVLGDCVPLPQCMLGIDNVHLLGYPLPDNPGGHDILFK